MFSEDEKEIVFSTEQTTGGNEHKDGKSTRNVLRGKKSEERKENVVLPPQTVDFVLTTSYAGF